MDIAERLATAAPGFIRPTRHLTVALDDPLAQTPAIAWWEDLCAAGGEGMVVKPWTSPTRGQRGLVQPGLKVRGQEYLRMTYGPGYLRPENLTRLRERSLGAKRSRALREYALGLEAIDRAVAGEPLWRIHAAVFAVLALESEPEDPRL
jgi:protein phosphatase